MRSSMSGISGVDKICWYGWRALVFRQNCDIVGKLESVNAEERRKGRLMRLA
jgi:hypothetical protein